MIKICRVYRDSVIYGEHEQWLDTYPEEAYIYELKLLYRTGEGPLNLPVLGHQIVRILNSSIFSSMHSGRATLQSIQCTKVTHPVKWRGSLAERFGFDRSVALSRGTPGVLKPRISRWTVWVFSPHPVEHMYN